ncbi:unnamed protein product [Sphagnum jensenii]
MDVAAAAVHVPAMHFSLPASSRLHPLRLLPTGASSSLLTSTCAAISRGLPVHHGLGRTAVLVGRRVFPRFWSVVITNPKDPFLAARNLGSTAAVASASGAASSASGSRNANVVRRWRPSTVVAGVGDLEGEGSVLRNLREVVKGKKILCTQVHRRKKERDTAKLIKQLGATQLQLLLGRVVVHSTNSEPSTRLLELDRPSHILLQLAAHNNVLLVEVVALMSLAVNSLVLVHMQNTSLVMKKMVQFLFIREKRTMLWVVAVTLQETVSKSRLAQEHEEKMQNGGDSRKRTGPNMKPGVMEEPKVKRRKRSSSI